MEVDGCKITYTVPHRIIYRESLKTLLTVLQYIEWSKYNIKQIKIYNDKNQSNVSFYKTTDGESKYNTIYINKA